MQRIRDLPHLTNAATCFSALISPLWFRPMGSNGRTGGGERGRSWRRDSELQIECKSAESIILRLRFSPKDCYLLLSFGLLSFFPVFLPPSVARCLVYAAAHFWIGSHRLTDLIQSPWIIPLHLLSTASDARPNASSARSRRRWSEIEQVIVISSARRRRQHLRGAARNSQRKPVEEGEGGGRWTCVRERGGDDTMMMGWP